MPRRSPLDHAGILRHFAICGAAVAAIVLYGRSGHALIGVLATGAIANLLLARVAVSPFASPLLGAAFWGAMVWLTGGATSPFVGGFWLEIVFSALVLPAGLTLAVTAGLTLVLWAVHGLRGAHGELPLLVLQSSFLAAVGLLTFGASRRWRLAHEAAAGEAQALSQRLRALERDLEAARRIGHVGERVARLAHGLKTTVHSLRGFAKLIEPGLASSASAGALAGVDAQRAALDGLRRAIDQLQSTAHSILQPAAPASASAPPSTGGELSRAMDAVITEVARSHDRIRWVKDAGAGLPPIALPASELHELLLIVAHNAAEASRDVGSVALRASLAPDGGAVSVVVEDEGPGFAPAAREAMYRPGITTKSSGSGYGLFLARRLVETTGGDIRLGTGPRGGGCVSIRLPVAAS
jgi:two-component system sensor histidine kinase RegB